LDSGQMMKVPLMGVGASTELSHLTSKQSDYLRSLGLHHYRIDVRPHLPDWVSGFSNACEQAYDLGLPLEVALHLSEDHTRELEAFLQLSLQNRLNIYKIVLFSEAKVVTSEEVIEKISACKTQMPAVLFGAGTDFNFTEINRNRFSQSAFDFLSYSLHPQEHAFDDTTLIENLEAQSDTIKSAKGIYAAAMRVDISPVTLRRRFNPYATIPGEKNKSENEKADPRQEMPFAAAWTTGSIFALAEGGAEAVTFFQTCGRQGLISANGNPFPVYYALKTLLELQGIIVEKLVSNKPLIAQAIRIHERAQIGIVNFSDSEQEVHYDNATFTLKPYEFRVEKLN
jgi:D-apionolactonase